jgi:CheY-like chemotaxis protein
MSSGPTKILVVDDDHLVRDFTVQAIEYGLDLKVEICESGFQAWRWIQDRPQQVDIVIMDANLPELGGFDLLARIKTSLPEKRVVILAGDPTLETEANRLGADAFVTKPYLAEDILIVLWKFVFPKGGTQAPLK